MTLSRALRWIADVQASGLEGVGKVDFLIDGKVVWTEKNVPYVFNDDAGLLAPWLLSPGGHVLTARATAADGQTGQAVTPVTAVAQPALPDALMGTFTRAVTQADIDRTASHPGREAETLPPGVWVMHVKDGLIRFDDPLGSGGAEAVTATATSLQMFGSPNWLLPEDRRGGFCHDEPPVSLHWKRSGKVLQMSGGGNCADRDALFVGTWRLQG